MKPHSTAYNLLIASCAQRGLFQNMEELILEMDREMILDPKVYLELAAAYP
jgi:pentatricopeptide repeat protein